MAESKHLAKMTKFGTNGDDAVKDDDSWMDDEKMFDMADEPSRKLESYYDITGDGQVDPDAKDLMFKIQTRDTLCDVLRRINPDMVAEVGQSSQLCCTTSIGQGELGCATKYGKTYFFPPGNYWWLGLGVSYDSTRRYENQSRENSGALMQWKDISYVNVADSNCAVVQCGKKQLILGPGRFVLRDPAQVYGNMVNVQKLKSVKTIVQRTEVAGTARPGQDPRSVQDVVQEKTVVAGRYEVCGAVTFVRAETGFCWVVQNVHGQLRTGIGMTVCRGGEVFLDFVDRQNYARTTRTFYFESSDRQEVQVRVQLRWRLEMAKVWMTRKGASEDIFDAIEEISESLLRDAIASRSYEECHLQASSGYDLLETSVIGALREEAIALGGVLIGFEIRSLRFPLLERRNQFRAQQETLLSEQILEEKRQLDIAVSTWKRDDATLLYQMKEEKNKVVHDTKMQLLRDSEDLKTMQAQATLEVTNQQFSIDKSIISLNAQKSQQILELDQKEAQIVSKIKRELIEAHGHADEKISDARAEADAVRAKCDAQAFAKLAIAESDAKAAELVGSAYRDNNAYMELKVAEMQADVQEARAVSVKTALSSNRLAMLPTKIQSELTQFIAVGSRPMPGGRG